MRRSRRGEGAFATVQYLVALSFSLAALVGLLNFVVFQYGRGAVRAALDEGTRAGSRVSASVEECEERAGRVLDDLLGGAMKIGVDPIVCSVTGDRVTAQTSVEFEPWFMRSFGGWQFTVSAVAVKEQAPR